MTHDTRKCEYDAMIKTMHKMKELDYTYSL